jgi:hypothetical protein
LKLRQEIEDDLAAGRLDQFDYDFCKQRIEAELADLAKPLPPGQKLRVIGIPKKKVDWDEVARIAIHMAENKLREDSGEPPPTEDEYRQRDVEIALAMREGKRLQEEEAERKQAAARRRFARRKPEELRQATWDWLLAQGLEGLPEDCRLGPLVHEFGILEQPNLLRGTIIQLDDGTDYVIDEKAAQALAAPRRKPVLIRLADRARVPTSRRRVVAAIANGPVFDQLNT